LFFANSFSQLITKIKRLRELVLVPDKKKPSKPPKLLIIDAWLDSSLYAFKSKFGDLWIRFNIFSQKFKPIGFAWVLVEILGEAFTLGVAGFVVMLTLALPAFEEVKGDWRNRADISVTFLDRYGTPIGQRGVLHKDGVSLELMPDHVIKAVLATEDRRFFEHFGIDFWGLIRALSENMQANGVVQGGSTITQQLAKNLFLTNERTIDRKIKEAFLSFWLEVNLTKKEILQLYLERAYMGGGTFGILAASEFYFDKNIEDVSLAEAAMLAGLFKSPTKYAPHNNLPAARARASEVLSNMVQAGFMTEGQVINARRNAADVVDRATIKSPDYFLDWAFENVKKTTNDLKQKSFVVKTTIDIDIQNAAEESIEFHLRQFGVEYKVTQSAIVVMDTMGAVRAMVGGRDYGASQFNRAAYAFRQAGSSFKPYVYATAMEHGYNANSMISDAPVSWGNWSPQNYTRSYLGTISLTEALVKSINTVPVRLAQKLKTTAIADMAYAMGVSSELSTHKTMCLGTSSMTVLDQATGYLTFANNGYSGQRHAFSEIYAHNGDILWSWQHNAPPAKKILTDQSVASMNEILAQVPEWGTGKRASIDGIRVAGKTGTTQSYRDAWFVGYTGNYVAAVWFGNDNFQPTAKLTGGLLPAMTFARLMAYAHQNVDLLPIPGLKKPFIEKTVPDIKELEIATKPLVDVRTKPTVLNAQTAKFLFDLQTKFSNSDIIKPKLHDQK
jgi:penicillin-binding protein 1A